MGKIDFSDLDNLFGNDETLQAQVKPQIKETPKPVVLPEQITTNQLGPVVDPLVLQTAQAKMSQIAVEMNNIFVEREELIKLMMLAITTGTNLLMLGPPGTARIDIIA